MKTNTNTGKDKDTGKDKAQPLRQKASDLRLSHHRSGPVDWRTTIHCNAKDPLVCPTPLNLTLAGIRP